MLRTEPVLQTEPVPRYRMVQAQRQMVPGLGWLTRIHRKKDSGREHRTSHHLKSARVLRIQKGPVLTQRDLRTERGREIRRDHRMEQGVHQRKMKMRLTLLG